ncbi:CoA transferase [Dehalococcoidia bacterium]|nr:CoA transferase [Dehalococcoidia bacterium]
MALPLEGMKVLDCTQFMAGPYCTLLLADLGADVVKVERLDKGDETRGQAPTIKGISAPFLMINRNKRSLAIDLKAGDGQAVFKSLADRFDVVVENMRPGVMESLNISYKDLRHRNRRIIYCSISGFGQTGPYKSRGGFDLVAQGMSGIMSVTGTHEGTMVKVGVPITDLAAGMYGANGILAAYIHCLKTGQGQQVDTSLYEAGIALTFWETGIYWATGEIPVPMGSAHRVSAPYQALRCKDKYITVGAANQANWVRLCRAIQMDDLAKDSRFLTDPLRRANYIELTKMIEGILIQKPADDWLEVLLKNGVPCGPLNNIADVYADPHTQARGMEVHVEHPVIGVVKNIGIPVKLSETPGSVRTAAPMLGQHSIEILTENGFSTAVVQDLIASGVVGTT